MRYKDKGWVSRMPKYYEPKNWQNRGSMKITPTSFWRKLPILKYILPYHVGDRVEFDIFTDKPNENKNASFIRQIVYEQLGSREKEYFCDINDKRTLLIGNMIPREGDVTYSLGDITNLLSETLIFTTTVVSWDTVRNNWFWAILAAIGGGIVSLATGLIFGIIKIDPAWILSVTK